MAKPKAPAWLREVFSGGVDAYTAAEQRIGHVGLYEGANRFCSLAQHDPAKRPCTPGRLERFHYIRRQDVEAAMWEQLRGAEYAAHVFQHPDPAVGGQRFFMPAEPLTPRERDDLILIAAWDPRNGGLACEQHHRRYDNHQVSLPRERVIVPFSAIPARVQRFGFDYFEGRLLDRFPSEI